MNRPEDSWGDQAVPRWTGGTAECLGYVSAFLPTMADSPRLTLMGVYILRDLLGILNIPLSPYYSGITFLSHNHFPMHILDFF